MKVWNGFAIVGFKLTDKEGIDIVDLNWAGVGAWQSQEIEDGQEIVGFNVNTSKYPNAIPRIGLVLWTPHFTDENKHKCRTGW